MSRQNFDSSKEPAKAQEAQGVAPGPAPPAPAPAHALLGMQQTFGNRAVGSLLQSGLTLPPAAPAGAPAEGLGEEIVVVAPPASVVGGVENSKAAEGGKPRTRRDSCGEEVEVSDPDLPPGKVQQLVEEIGAFLRAAEEKRVERDEALPEQPAGDKIATVTLDVPIDDALKNTEDINYELAGRAFRILFGHYGINLNPGTAGKLYRRSKWIPLMNDAGVRAAVAAARARGEHTIKYVGQGMPSLLTYYKQIRAEEEAHYKKLLEDLHDCHYAENAVKSFYIAHWNGLVEFIGGVADLIPSPINLVRSALGMKGVQLDLGAVKWLKMKYPGEYGNRHGETMEAGVMTGLMLVPGGALSEGLAGGTSWLARLVSRVRPGGVPVGPAIVKFLRAWFTAGVISAGVTSAEDLYKTARQLITGRKELPDGTTQPLSGDDAGKLLESVIMQALGAYGGAKSVLHLGPAQGKTPPPPAEVPPEPKAAPPPEATPITPPPEPAPITPPPERAPVAPPPERAPAAPPPEPKVVAPPTEARPVPEPPEARPVAEPPEPKPSPRPAEEVKPPPPPPETKAAEPPAASPVEAAPEQPARPPEPAPLPEPAPPAEAPKVEAAPPEAVPEAAAGAARPKSAKAKKGAGKKKAAKPAAVEATTGEAAPAPEEPAPAKPAKRGKRASRKPAEESEPHAPAEPPGPTPQQRMESLQREKARLQKEQQRNVAEEDALLEREGQLKNLHDVAEENLADLENRARVRPEVLEQARRKAEAAKEAWEEGERQLEEAQDKIAETTRKIKENAADIERAKIALDPKKHRGLLPCFSGDTAVWTADGPRRIDGLAPGATVLAFDFSRMDVVRRAVLAVLRNRTEHFYDVRTDGGVVRATGRHRFWVESESAWVAARELRPGMLLRTPDGRAAAVSSVALREVPGAASYNLSVEGAHNYFVGPGLLVHNAGPVDVNLARVYVIYRARYKGKEARFKDKSYIGQTTEVSMSGESAGKPRGVEERGAEHVANAERELELHKTEKHLSAKDIEFYNFMKDAVLEEIVVGIETKAQADYLEQKNLEAERTALGDDALADIREPGEKKVLNRREQIKSESHRRKVEKQIIAELAAQGRPCPP
ncbi:MAG TPA: polymorphic toxin-type HINT domain-containing protein [Pyrinomonadaceae bacterium]|jgi:hypothetical protein